MVTAGPHSGKKTAARFKIVYPIQLLALPDGFDRLGADFSIWIRYGKD
jgi:hypothetical protein